MPRAHPPCLGELLEHGDTGADDVRATVHPGDLHEPLRDGLPDHRRLLPPARLRLRVAVRRRAPWRLPAPEEGPVPANASGHGT